MEERNHAVDLGKYLAALCIIAIHTEPLAELSSSLNFFTVQIIARLAVPFFAITSGFFAAESLKKQGSAPQEARKAFFTRWRKLILIYGLWSILYLLFSIPGWIRTGWFSAWAFVDYGIATLLSSSHYHLWYLLALIYAWPVFYLSLRFLDRKAWLLLSFLFYGVFTVYYCYSAFLPEAVQRVFSRLGPFEGVVMNVLLILSLLLLGACQAEKKKQGGARELVGFSLCFLLLCAEAVVLSKLGQTKVSYLALTYPTALFLFRLVRDSRIAGGERLCRQLGAASLTVYCVHPMFVEIMERWSFPHAARFAIAAILSTLLGFLWFNFTRNRKKCA